MPRLKPSASAGLALALAAVLTVPLAGPAATAGPATTLPASVVRAPVDLLPWMNPDLEPAVRAELLISAMTLDQKIQQIANQPQPNPDLNDGGDVCNFTAVGRHIEGIAELGIPDFRQANGGTGIRGGDCTPEPNATGLPAQIASAATFNRDLAYRWGQLLDTELRAWAHHVLWGPGMNLVRTPYGGRNQEYFSEDPYLTGAMSSQIVKGVQARGVSQVTIKHFAANESEYQFERWTSAHRVPSRAMHELYLLPFEMAVKDAQPTSIMCAYPHVNFSYACDSSPLLQQTLRQRWGFDGYVFSDRRAQQSTVPSILAGVDVELDEAPEWYTPRLIKAAIINRQITEGHIDDLLRERYIKMFEFGDFEDKHDEFLWDEINLTRRGAHAKFAKEAASESLVLLRNDKGLLPLNSRAVESIALVGPDWFAGEATLPPRSGDRLANITVRSPYEVTPEQGLENTIAALGSDAEVTYNDGDVIADAVALAAESDVVILMIGDVARETWDKNGNLDEENPRGNASGAPNEVADLDLPSVNGTNQQMLIPRILAANPNTVVVMKTQGQVNMPWVDDAQTLVQAWYPGQEDGNVVADALFGVTNFSGKLPVTIGRTDREAAYERTEQYPGNHEQTGTPGGYGRDPIPGEPQRVVRYSEGLKLGYRWYESTNTTPLFPFGFGLSYTSFEYSGLNVTEVPGDNGHAALKVDYTVTNTGDRAGKEASQVYLTLPSKARQPSKRLVEFAKVQLAPGESKAVSVTLDSGSSNHPFSYFAPDDPDDLRKWADGDWKTADGDYTVSVGGSSADTPLTQTVAMNFSNRTPVASNVTATVPQDSSVIVDLKANDPDGDALTYTYTGTGNSTVTPVGDGSAVRFAPAAGFTGTKSFTYTVSDNHGGTAKATVKVAVTKRPATTVSGIKVAPTKITSRSRAVVSFTVASAGKPAQGDVVVKLRDKIVGEGTLDARGAARFRLDRLKPGTHALSVVYLGSETSAAVTKKATIRVSKAGSVIRSLKVRPTKLTTKQRATVSFRVATGSAAATGKVVVKVGKKVVGKGTLNKRGVAKVRIARLKAGTTELTILYRGNTLTKSVKVTKKIVVVRK